MRKNLFLGFICFATVYKQSHHWGDVLAVQAAPLPSLDPPSGPLPTKQVYFCATFNKHAHTPGIAYYIRYRTDT